MLWNTIGEPENDQREKEMTQSRSLHNARVYYPLMETNQDSSFLTLTLKKKKNTDKSLLCAVCPHEVKKMIIDYNQSTKKHSGKHLLNIISPYQLKKK